MNKGVNRIGQPVPTGCPFILLDPVLELSVDWPIYIQKVSLALFYVFVANQNGKYHFGWNGKLHDPHIPWCNFILIEGNDQFPIFGNVEILVSDILSKASVNPSLLSTQ